MKHQDYGRNPNKRKAYVKQKGLLMVSVDISKDKHDASIGTIDMTIQSNLKLFP